jgi:hypothetical protein
MVLVFSLLSFILVKAQTDEPVVWWDTGMVKLRKPNTGTNSDAIPADAASRGPIVLSAARNEFEPFQIFIAAQSSAVSQADVTVSDLTDGHGNIIAALDQSGKPKNVVIYREHYLNVTQKSNAISSLGLTPDALIPKIDEYYGEARKVPGESGLAFPFNVATNSKQAVWVDVYVPTGTPAGLYSGSVNITIGGSLYTQIPIQLKVRDFELPSTPSLQTAYAVGTSEMTRGHYNQPISGLPEETGTTLLCLYTKELLQNRISNELAIWPKPTWTGSTIDWTIPAASAASKCKERYPDFLTGGNPNLLPGGKLPGAKLTQVRFREDKVFSGTTLAFAAQQYGSLANYKNYLNQYISHFTQNGWHSQLFYYMYDEPVFRQINGVWHCDIEWNGSPSTDWTTLYDKSKWFKDNTIDVPVLVTTNRQAVEFCIPNYIGDSNWQRYVDIYTVGNRQMHGKPFAVDSPEDPTGPPFNQNLRGTYDPIITPPSKQLWWYHACGNHECGGTTENEYIAPMADLPGVYSRMFEWLTFRYQVGYTAPGPDAELYYETVYAYNQWNGVVNSASDPWNNIFYFTGNGDGTFFYPGRPNTIGGTGDIPIPSIRLKLLREGIEDFEYLKLVEAKKNQAGLNGKQWIYDNILIPYLADVDSRDSVTKFITYVWEKNPGSATSAKGLFRGREELAKVLDTAVQPDIAVSVSPSSATVAPSEGATANVTVTSIGGFNSAVSLSCSSPHATVTCGLNPTSVTPPSNQSASSSLTVTTQAGTPGGSYPITITATSGTLSDQTTFTLGVQVPPPSNDTFTRANSTSLGPDWNEALPNLEIFSNQVRNVDAGGKEAIWVNSLGPDQDVAADVKVTVTGNSAGVVARWSDVNNFYRARLDVGAGNIVLFKTVAGVTTQLGVATRTLSYNTYYRVRLVAQGSLLSVYFGNENAAAIAVSDTSLTTGNFAGIISFASAAATTWFDNFSVAIPSKETFNDTFDRVNSTALGSDWNESLPNLEIFSNQLRNVDAGNKEAVFVQGIGPDQEVSADVKVTATGNSAAVVARWSDSNNLYRVRLDVGAGNIVVFKTVGGVSTQLGAATRALSYNTFYRLRLIVQGSSLSAYFAGETTPAISVTDTSLTTGNYAGVRSFAAAAATTYYENFSVTFPFNDTFDRANSTALGSRWNEDLPDLDISSNQLRNVDAGSKSAVFTRSIGPDQDVAADGKVTVAGNMTAVVARWSDANNFYYARIDAGLGTVALFKRVGGVTTKLLEVPRSLSFNTYYRMRLVIQGSSLSVYFAGEVVPAISVTDTSLPNGNYAGVRSYASGAATAWIDNFKLSLP